MSSARELHPVYVAFVEKERDAITASSCGEHVAIPRFKQRVNTTEVQFSHREIPDTDFAAQADKHTHTLKREVYATRSSQYKILQYNIRHARFKTKVNNSLIDVDQFRELLVQASEEQIDFVALQEVSLDNLPRLLALRNQHFLIGAMGELPHQGYNVVLFNSEKFEPYTEAPDEATLEYTADGKDFTVPIFFAENKKTTRIVAVGSYHFIGGGGAQAVKECFKALSAKIPSMCRHLRDLTGDLILCGDGNFHYLSETSQDEAEYVVSNIYFDDVSLWINPFQRKVLKHDDPSIGTGRETGKGGEAHGTFVYSSYPNEKRRPATPVSDEVRWDRFSELNITGSDHPPYTVTVNTHSEAECTATTYAEFFQSNLSM